jgi:tetratricopeptide (TPR) repeat protein
VALVPVMGLSRTTFMEYSLVADHYQYIAVIGVLALAAAGWAVWQRQARGPSRLAANGVAAAVVGLFALLTWRQSGFYSDSITLYQASLDSSPDSSMAHNNLGAQLFDAGRLPEAIEHDQRALQLKPDYPEAHNNLGNALSSTGRIAEAIEHYKEALRIRPTYLEAHNNLGSALAYTGQFQEGIGHLQEALRLKPDYADARKNLEMAETLQRNAQARQ